MIMVDEITLDYPDVLAAARAIVAEAGNDPGKGEWRSYELPGLLAARLDVTGLRGTATTHRQRACAERFDKQCGRAFNELAAEGTLIKAGRGERAPSGYRLGNEARFYTPAAHSQAVGDRARALAAAAQARHQWETVYDRLSDAGLAPVSAYGQPVELLLPVWVELLGKLD